MPERYFLHRCAYCCVLDDGAIFLDVLRGQYVAINAARLPLLARQVAHWLIPCPSASSETSASAVTSARFLDELETRGILTTSEGDSKPAEQVQLAVRTSMPAISYRTNAPRLRPSDVARFLIALIRVTNRLHRRNLLRMVRNIEAAKMALSPNAAQGNGPDAMALTRTFERLRVWAYSADGACLKDSLVLTEFLLRSGATATFVIGVRSKPFSAHAWVQSGDVVLNDFVERVQRYIPILAV